MSLKALIHTAAHLMIPSFPSTPHHALPPGEAPSVHVCVLQEPGKKLEGPWTQLQHYSLSCRNCKSEQICVCVCVGCCCCHIVVCIVTAVLFPLKNVQHCCCHKQVFSMFYTVKALNRNWPLKYMKRANNTGNNFCHWRKKHFELSSSCLGGCTL